jgi:hypothetical protein
VSRVDLAERRVVLERKRDGLLKEISRLSEIALTNDQARIQYDQRQADVGVIENELQQVKAEIEKAARTGPSATELFFAQYNGGGGIADIPAWCPEMATKQGS